MTRADRLIQALHMGERQAALIHNPSNIFYLSGYAGEGLLLIAPAVRAIVTDFRYTEQAENQGKGFSVHMTDAGRTQEQVVEGLCGQYGLDELYYEDETLSVKAFAKLQANVPGKRFTPIGGAPERLREIKDEGELALIERACDITGEAFERLLAQIREGVTEKELALMLEYDMLRHGATGLAFSTIVAAGANGSLPHAVPGDYAVRAGDMITFDFGAKVGGYCADMTRTVALGQPSAEMRRVYGIVQTAQQLAQDAVQAGRSCREIDAIARDYIYQNGYEGRFGHGLGHSLGIDIHEEPRFNTSSEAVAQASQVMTVEPGIYLPGVGGVRIENSVVVLEGGCKPLTKPTRELIIL